MTRWLVTGAGGMLGRDMMSVLAGHEVTGLSRHQLDVTDEFAVLAALADHDVVVNCAAWTDVDGAEAHEDDAMQVNGRAAELLARACAVHGARLAHLSTDYVFDGTGTSPYAEDAPLSPRSAYGRTKALGEQAVRQLLPESAYVVRTAWLYGEYGKNFVRTMMALERTRETIDVVEDQVGTPTWSRQVAAAIVRLVQADAPVGTYHATAKGSTTWFGLARAVFEELGADPARVRPTTSELVRRPAPRPAYAVLGHDRWQRAGLAAMEEWRPMLSDAMTRMAVREP